jgi:bifunctional non-homologous end joining protein LigD
LTPSPIFAPRKSAFEPCIQTRGAKVPDRPEWIHEIKHDGYRLIIERAGKTVRLWTRNGHDWSSRYPLITEAALRNRNSSFVIDGEAVRCVDGDRWVAIWRAPPGRGFDRCELLPGDRLHDDDDEGGKPPVQVNGELPRRALRAARVV